MSEPEPQDCPICLRPMEPETCYYRQVTPDEAPRVFSYRWECENYDHNKDHHSLTIERMASP